MAAAGDIQDLCDELTCPICLDCFRDPVIIVGCGHNFCRACLAQCWGEEEDAASCPQCRETVQQKGFFPNRELKNVVEIAKKLILQGRAREAEGVCERHQEPLKLFCKDHKAPICVVCDKSKEHESHKVVPQEEAFQAYKDRIYSSLKILRAERDKILMFKANTEKESQDLLNQTEAERQKTMAEFEQMRQFLDKEEKSLLAQVEEVEKEIARRRDEHVARLCRELSSLEHIIQEMEEKCQQPAYQFLQDVRNTMKRCEEKETFENPVVFPPELKWKAWEFCDLNPYLKGVMKRFKDNLVSGLQMQKANVTLDPDTAHPSLIPSADRKSVRKGDKNQDLPKHPERFDEYNVVLGCEEFTTGRHFWDIGVGSEEAWIVGVAGKSIRRKGAFVFSPEGRIWAIGKWAGSRAVLNKPYHPRLALSSEPQRIRVCLNYEGGQVAFFDVEQGCCIYTFSAASFTRETLLPLFWVYENGHIRICP